MPRVDVAPSSIKLTSDSRTSVGNYVGPDNKALRPKQSKGISTLLWVLLAVCLGVLGAVVGRLTAPSSSDSGSEACVASTTSSSTSSLVVVPKYGPFPMRAANFAPCKCQNYSSPDCNLTWVTGCLKQTSAQNNIFFYNTAVGTNAQYPTTIFANKQDFEGNMSKWRHTLHDLLPNRGTEERITLDTTELGYINTYAETTRYAEIGDRYGALFQNTPLPSSCYKGIFCHQLALDQKGLWQDLFYHEDCLLDCPIMSFLNLYGLQVSAGSMATLEEFGSYILTGMKTYFDRARPFMAAGAYNVSFPYLSCLSGETPAFPSGHNTDGKVLGAGIYDDNFASFNNNATMFRWFLRFVYDIGERRVIAGVHWPSDGFAGNHIANEIMKLRWPSTSGAYLHFPENQTEYEIMCGVTYPSTCDNPRIPHVMP